VPDAAARLEHVAHAASLRHFAGHLCVLPFPQPGSLRPDEVTVHGHTLSYRLAGRGPALVLLHGIAESSDSWEELIPVLAKHFTMIAPDLLGHGRSSKPVSG
jgi:alpha-beta hydrolase superfamily lysophospholipase